MENYRETNRQLLLKLDSKDGFIKGHSVKGPRRTSRRVPAWAKSEERIRAILRKSFPKWEENPVQRKRAGIWARLIQLFFVTGMTRGQVAEEMNLDYGKVKDTIRSIKRVVKGYRAGDGLPRMREIKVKKPTW